MKTSKKTTEITEIPIHKIRSWCWSKGISIYPVPYVSNGSRLKICLNKKRQGNHRQGYIRQRTCHI
ncbi:hypothetical protein QIU19_00345 [Capnocytophaga canimorsus]|nr:hypothetical protein [Capnocytophaga canimorsus]WGU68518.1 hypothetical protein QIU19_00345 [Capnocytophaga canimorsus]